MKRAFFVFGGGAVLIAAGVFVFMSKPAVAPDQLPTPSAPAIEESDLRDPDEIAVVDNGDGTKKVRDSREGYEISVPDDWQIQKPIFISNGLTFFDNENVCRFDAGFLSTEETVAELLRQSEERTQEDLTVQKSETEDIVVADLGGIRRILETEEFGYSETIYLESSPIFQVVMFVQGENRGTCIQGFNQVLDSLVFS